VAQTGVKPQPEGAVNGDAGEIYLPEITLPENHDGPLQHIRMLWQARRFLLRASAVGLLASTLIAFVIPKSYTATTRLMPPDSQSTSGIAMMAALAGKAGPGLGSVAGDLLGLKSSGALFVGVLRSHSAQEKLIEEFGLKKVYGKRLLADSITQLDENTSISEDRKSGIITISVTDHDADRSAALANGYVSELNALVTSLSTSAAHRERVFLEQRLTVAKQELDTAANNLAQFSSKHNTLDMQTEGKAMLDAAGAIAGQLIAAQSELEGLRQIYTDNNPRVRALNGRVAELRRQLEKLGGSLTDDAKDSEISPQLSNGTPFPTIRSLPLLGAKYSDYYRRAKIQETVFELLTEQYELAKVEEAKETPSVKILDPAQKPEKKSFPPRLLIVFLGTFLVLSACVVGVLGTNQWRATDADDPRKVFAQEVFETVKVRTRWISRNGHGGNGQLQKPSTSRNDFDSDGER
jgi:uncharacterized protein involved in exopolysaccharide biosynthesis